ncbi:MAG: glycosyltransferase family 2 protein [Acholeplasmataceae bacterium]|nr:glycosyltransferase family 2 protein [Acholeplasmataceae bacterium]
MKLITFAIPAYNSQAYLENAIESLLFVKERAEIIIINDGSTDDTLKIAQEYQKKYPETIKVVDKENAGHGSGVNKGLELASGLYYKVVDSDDWLDHVNIIKFVDTIERHYQNANLPDLYVLDFIYERVSDNTSFVRSYQENFPTNIIFGWDDIKKSFKYSKTMLMHAQVFKTSVLRESKVNLPENTFYVDNIFAFNPLPYVKKIYYLPFVLYHYYIGREDQSVTFSNITKRYQQQIRVMELLLNEFSYQEIMGMSKGLRRYIKHYLSAIMIITQMFTTALKTKERKRQLKRLWSNLKANDPKMYRFLKYRSYNVVVNFLPWRIKGFVMVRGYQHLARKIKLG